MGRSPCCGQGDELKKGPWTSEEDEKLVSYVKTHGDRNWRALPKNAGLNRCGKSCRLRWTNYLRTDIKRGRFSKEEEDIIIKLHSVLGNKWSRIATHLPGRTDNEIKNYWNTNLKKKLLQMGVDPVTHRPTSDLNLFASVSELVSLSMSTNPSYDINDLRLHSNAAHELAKIHVLQSLIQLLGPSSSTPSINQYSTAPLGLSPHANNQLGSLNTTDVLNVVSPISCVGVSSPTRSESDQPGAQAAEGGLLGLTSACSTGTLSVSENAVGNGDSGDGSIFQSLGEYDLVDGWERLIDDDGNSDSFWSDLLI